VGDLRPGAIKVGMLGDDVDIALEVGRFLKIVNEMRKGEEESVFVVLDPVMISTSGHKLIGDKVKEVMIEYLFPYVDLITPNKFEAEELLGRKLVTVDDVEKGARDILKLGAKAVLIKGGHSLTESRNDNDDTDTITKTTADDTKYAYAEDYFLSTTESPPLSQDEERLCDGSRGVWLRSHRVNSIHTHGTGCTLSSVIAAAMAIGRQQRVLLASGGGGDGVGTGAAIAIEVVDACCIAKEYVTAGVDQGVQLGAGPGPVAHTNFANSHRYFPFIPRNPSIITTNTAPLTTDSDSIISDSFRRMRAASPPIIRKDNNNNNGEEEEVTPVLGKIMPIVDSVEWIKRLCHESTSSNEITDVQLRIKNETDETKITSLIYTCQTICATAGIRLWINDYWKAAIQAKCFGVHLGQEDLKRCADEGGLERMREENIALGISTHSYAELAVACGIHPTYISLGPVFGTRSKNVAFRPQGLETVKLWRKLVDPGVPLIAIGGIDDAGIAGTVRKAGADSIAVIGALTRADDVASAVRGLVAAME